ncbi:unnamed protein product, partial [Mesorhabditis belari]|uniref:Uncharacterized protein n=1 Tax=Mesorhabditis belari TaxID=2138241 RepID=A0AAF3F2F4_9BILA
MECEDAVELQQFWESYQEKELHKIREEFRLKLESKDMTIKKLIAGLDQQLVEKMKLSQELSEKTTGITMLQEEIESLKAGLVESTWNRQCAIEGLLSKQLETARGRLQNHTEIVSENKKLNELNASYLEKIGELRKEQAIAMNNDMEKSAQIKQLTEDYQSYQQTNESERAFHEAKCRALKVELKNQESALKTAREEKIRLVKINREKVEFLESKVHTLEAMIEHLSGMIEDMRSQRQQMSSKCNRCVQDGVLLHSGSSNSVKMLANDAGLLMQPDLLQLRSSSDSNVELMPGWIRPTDAYISFQYCPTPQHHCRSKSP